METDKKRKSSQGSNGSANQAAQQEWLYSRAGKGHQMNFPIKVTFPKVEQAQKERERKEHEHTKNKHILLRQEFDFDKIHKDFDAIKHAQLVKDEKLKKIRAKEEQELKMTIAESNSKNLEEMVKDREMKQMILNHAMANMEKEKEAQRRQRERERREQAGRMKQKLKEKLLQNNLLSSLSSQKQLKPSPSETLSLNAPQPANKVTEYIQERQQYMKDKMLFQIQQTKEMSTSSDEPSQEEHLKIQAMLEEHVPQPPKKKKKDEEELAGVKSFIAFGLESNKLKKALPQQKKLIKQWRQKIDEAKQNKTSSFLAITRENAKSLVEKEPPANHFLGKYRPRYSRVQKRTPYQNLGFDGIVIKETANRLKTLQVPSDEQADEFMPSYAQILGQTKEAYTTQQQSKMSLAEHQERAMNQVKGYLGEETSKLTIPAPSSTKLSTLEAKPSNLVKSKQLTLISSTKDVSTKVSQGITHMDSFDKVQRRLEANQTEIRTKQFKFSRPKQLHYRSRGEESVSPINSKHFHQHSRSPPLALGPDFRIEASSKLIESKKHFDKSKLSSYKPKNFSRKDFTDSALEPSISESQSKLARFRDVMINRDSFNELARNKKSIMRQSLDTATFLDHSPTRDMFTNHMLGPNEKRFMKNDTMESQIISQKFKKQPQFVDMGKQMRTLQEKEENGLIKKNSIRCPLVYPNYHYDRDLLLPKSDLIVPDFSKQISPRRGQVGILGQNDSMVGRSSALNNAVKKRQREAYKSVDFQQTMYDQGKVISGLDAVKKKQGKCYVSIDKQIPRDESLFFINEGNNLNKPKLPKVPRAAYNSVTIDAVPTETPRPFQFMDILPQRVKLAKMYSVDFCKQDEEDEVVTQPQPVLPDLEKKEVPVSNQVTSVTESASSIQAQKALGNRKTSKSLMEKLIDENKKKVMQRMFDFPSETSLESKILRGCFKPKDLAPKQKELLDQFDRKNIVASNISSEQTLKV